MDTSFILTAIELGGNLFTSLDELVGPVKKITVKQVVDELREMSLGRGRKAIKAKLAFKLVKNLDVVSLNPNLNADDEIVNVASEKNLIVATTDSNLIKKLRTLNLPVIYVKDKVLRIEGLTNFC